MEYTLTNAVFDIEDNRIIASADILEDGVVLQSFSVSLPLTTSATELGRAVASYAKNIVIHNTLIANTFVVATEWLIRQSWIYG